MTRAGRLVAPVVYYLPPIALALALHLWSAAQWPANLDSDEAVIGLMARHAMQGSYVTYMYGQSYLGSFEALLASVLMRIFGDDPFVFRMSAVLLFGLFLIVHATHATRLFGRTVAVASLYILAMPSWLILWWIYRPIGSFDSVLLFGSLTGLIAEVALTARRWRLWVAVLGAAVGFGFWVHPLVTGFVIATALAYLPLTEAWRAAKNRFDSLSAGWLGIPGRELAPLLTVAVGGLVIAAFFSSGCAPVQTFRAFGFGARIAVVVMLAAGALLAVMPPRQNRALLTGIGAFALGLVAGNVPQWWAWAVNGQPPSFEVLPACPVAVLPHADLVLDQLLPGLWGGARISALWSVHGGAGALATTALAVVALAAFLWYHRVALWRVLALAPGRCETRGPIYVVALLAVPIMLALLGSNVVNIWSVRYLIAGWPAFALILAWCGARCVERSRHRRALVTLSLLIWLGLSTSQNLERVRSLWSERSDWWAPASTARLEEFLAEHGTSTGYGDYWIAHAINFTTAERLHLAQFNGALNNGNTQRYQPYADEAARATARAYLLWVDQGAARARGERIEDLIERLRTAQSAGPAYSNVLDDLRSGWHVTAHRQILNWDVWIVAAR